jgi:D-alanyl-D-alanine carboxypeptidase/D-alanyl-D-alanine-endopeptidase (penicillin-binding protein 4)
MRLKPGLLLILLVFNACGIELSPIKTANASESAPKGVDPAAITIGEDSSKPGTLLDEHFDKENIGFIVYDIKKKEVLFSHNRNQAFIPASCAKIVTVMTALDTLGGDYRFKTTLSTDGLVKDGVIEGNLYLHGTGDPSFRVSDIIDMVNRLKLLGIREIAGNFHYDRSSLPKKEILDPTMDLDQSYNTGVSALSTDYNYIDARWFNNSDNKKPDIILTPDLPMFSARPSSKKKEEIPDLVKFEYKEGGDTSVWELSPDANLRGSERLPVRKPALYTAQLFTHIANIHGISIPWPTHGLVPTRSTVLIEHKGKSVAEIAETTMHYSVNLHAELLYLNSAKKLFGEKVDYDESSRLMGIYLKEKFTGIDWSTYQAENGSGLSSKNRITPEQMLALLIYADSKEFDGRSFSYYLQPAGWNYSLRNRFYKPQQAFRIYAKTGTINYAVGLAGYLHTLSGKHLLFVFFNSNSELRKKHELNPDRYGKSAYNTAMRWNRAHRNEMDKILSHWIETL